MKSFFYMKTDFEKKISRRQKYNILASMCTATVRFLIACMLILSKTVCYAKLNTGRKSIRFLSRMN